MASDIVGTIEPRIGAVASKEDWTAIIGVHPSLGFVELKNGINPFTREPMVFKPRLDTARVLIGGTQVGLIHSAMDESQELVVWSEPSARTAVAHIAEDVATRLGWRFVASAEA